MARSLIRSKIAKAIRTAQGGASEDDRLLPGHMRLYSYYKPSLAATSYAIEVTQRITAIGGDDDPKDNAQELTVFNSTPGIDKDKTPVRVRQSFQVVAPQFSLDPKLINTFYPPAGHQDEAHILPHIVFNDPHVPWFREAGLSNWMLGPIDKDPSETLGHNLVPWLALLVFQPDDLKLDSSAANAMRLDTIKAKNGTYLYNSAKLPANGAFDMSVGNYLSLDAGSRVWYEAGYTSPPDLDYFNKVLKSSPDSTSAIFPTKTQLKSLMLDQTGALAPLEAQKLMAHVRHINTVGFPDAGVEEEGFYSVVVSSMTGNQKELTASTHIVHLVSLEFLDSTLTDKSSPFLTSTTDRIGLVSLFSWTYQCIPDSIAFYDTMEAVALQAQPLRPPVETLKSLLQTSKTPNKVDPNASVVAKTLYDRLSAGYTIARWRTPTGEESVAFNRGPLVPLGVDEVPMVAAGTKTRPWPALSMTGKDYQVFDGSVGIMDVTYSSAWSLGKLMAISNSSFNAALMRFRSTIFQTAASSTRVQVNGMQRAATVLQHSLDAVRKAQDLAAGTFTGPVSRVNKPAQLGVTTSMRNPRVASTFRDAISTAVAASASTRAGTVFNGFDGASSTNSDWEIILNWIHDAMYLSAIPAHVLFPEPSHLQSHNTSAVMPDQPTANPEALRFFHIDHAWIDCFLDGALSCANHLEPDYDYTRLSIKAAYNDYLRTPIASTGLIPPVPRYGFILRSAVVKSTPDLRLTVTCYRQDSEKGWIEDLKRDPLVQHTKLDDFTILSLVDCAPDEIFSITFAQPPHQQRFSFPCNPVYSHTTGLVTQVKSDMKLKRLYTDPTQAPPVSDPYIDTSSAPPRSDAEKLQWEDFPANTWLTRDDDSQSIDQANFYNDNTRCINAALIAKTANDKLNLWAQGSLFGGKPPYYDPIPSSCVMGLELNDSSVQLTIKNPTPTAPFPSWTRQLWTGQPPAPSPRTPADSSSGGVSSGNNRGSGFNAPVPHATSAIVSPKSISLPRQDVTTLLARLPARMLPHRSQAIPRSLAVASRGRGPTPSSDPFTNSPEPMFELLIHPDYRPPPPRPSHDPRNTGFTNDVYSPLDYLATQTQSLYDLVFAVRRRGQLATPLTLQSLTIEVPVSDGAGDKPDARGYVREPLLMDNNYAGSGARMCSNQRFVPELYRGVASPIGSDQWDGKRILGIRLVPRSGLATGNLPLAADARAHEASVRLGDARLAPIADTKATVRVAQGIDPTTGKPWDKTLPRGRCLVRLTEHYGNRPDQYSWCVALKIDGPDKDPLGNKI
ncbi:hypothetical protein GQ53DRAFT_847524 [Thozetella sp. PMI_491]|nr:hypothetical protein GQ53DRAFT_847524 [Thozetella sp. PMI_491]